MTVAEMIACLQTHPPEMLVCSQDRDGDLWFANEPYVTTAKIEDRKNIGTRYHKTMCPEDWAKVPPETVLVI